MKIALLQTPVCSDKAQNLAIAESYIAQAAEQGAAMAILPEMFLCPYENRCFPLYAEEAGGASWQQLSRMAKEYHLTLVAGSMPEKDGDKLYNTSFVFNDQGQQIACHRKAHLFDIDVEGGQKFQESLAFTPGDTITTFQSGGHTFGLCICFDLRFPEAFRTMALQGAEAVIIPAAFNMTTGPMHWELTLRARALDNQLFTVAVAPARDEQASYVSYANSMVCSPWGSVAACAGTEPNILIWDLDFQEVGQVRRQLPLLSARRPALYAKYPEET